MFSLVAIIGIMTRTKPTIIELDMNKLEDILRRVETQELHADDYETIRTLGQSYVHLTELLKDKNASLGRLRKMLFGAKTEKTATVLGSSQISDIPLPSSDDAHPDLPLATNAESNLEGNAETDAKNDFATPGKGHSRNGATAYTGAEKIEVPLASLQAGDPCPKCGEGTVYETNRPGVLIRLVALSQRRDRPGEKSFSGGTITLSPSSERFGHGGTSCLAYPAVRPAASGAELGAGQGHLRSAESLEEADAFPARGWGTLGQ